jgi:hypothetical protein
MVAGLRRDGIIRDAELTLARGLEGSGTLRMQVRVAPLKAGRVLVLAEDRTAARRVEEMRRDFTANVSHELKTPVGAISLLAETIADSADEPDTVRHFAGRMGKESRRLAALVQEIIELSRLQEPDALVEPELVEVDDVVAEAVDRVRVEAQARKVTLVLGGTQGVKVYGDPDDPVAAQPRDHLTHLGVGQGVVADQAEAVGRGGGAQDVVVGLEHDDALGQHGQDRDGVVLDPGAIGPWAAALLALAEPEAEDPDGAHQHAEQRHAGEQPHLVHARRLGPPRRVHRATAGRSPAVHRRGTACTPVRTWLRYRVGMAQNGSCDIKVCGPRMGPCEPR